MGLLNYHVILCNHGISTKNRKSSCATWNGPNIEHVTVPRDTWEVIPSIWEGKSGGMQELVAVPGF